MNKPTCILCDKPYFLDGLCEGHSAEFFCGPDGQSFNDFIRERVHAMRDATLKYMESVQAEADHLRMRARQALAGDIPVQHLAHSVIVHTNVIAKEK